MPNYFFLRSSYIDITLVSSEREFSKTFFFLRKKEKNYIASFFNIIKAYGNLEIAC